MKNPTPILVARLSAFAVALLMMIMLVLLRLFNLADFSWWIVILAPLILFLLAILIFSYAVEFFIYRKIKLIYKTIYDTKASQTVRPRKLKMNGGILDDVTEEVDEWQKTTTKRQKKMRKLDTFRKEFLANVFHELKTPVFNIQGYLETLIEGAVSDEKVNKKFLQKAIQNVDRITNIVNDLQLISNLEEGSFELNEEKFDISELVIEVIESLDIVSRAKNIRITIKDGCSGYFPVRADRDMISQVLTNLIANSVKYGNEGGKTQIGMYDMNENILVEVTDDGIGIDKVHLPRIFERFYRVDKDRSRQQGGSGLGLSIVKHIIERHEMTVNARSTPGVGSTFGFTLAKA